jgi:hypothetical protein
MMTGINFIDTIVVRHSLERGTASEEKPVMPAEFMGKETRKTNDDRLKLAGNLMIMSAKGTKKIRLSDLETPTLPADFKGHYVTTGRGTGRVRL